MDFNPPGCSRYQYDTFSTEHPIRLLTLFPADSFDAPLKCRLETTDLMHVVQSGVHAKLREEAEQASDDTMFERDSMAFEALSYTWGSPEHDSNIILDDDRVLPITANLSAFLHYRREKDHPVRLWVDAVCINQNDTKERNRQVSSMNMLYAAAPLLTIWLGPPDTESDAAMRELRKLSGGHPYQKLHTMERGVFVAIEKLLSRDWWTRVWIIQELRFGADYSERGNTLVMCGQECIKWPSLILACARLELSGRDWRRGSPKVDNALRLDALARSSFLTPEVSLQEYQTYNITRLFRNVIEFRPFKATDPKDKIFALSGMILSAEYPGPAMPVLYEFSKEEIYSVFAATVMKLTNDLSVLSHSQKQLNSINLPDTLPSWVPDWSSPLYTTPLPSRHLQEQSVLPWWSLPHRNETREGYTCYRLDDQEVLRKLAKDFLEASSTCRFDTLPSWLTDTLPTEMMDTMRELIARQDLIVCTVNEGDVMDGEKLSMDDALSRRITNNEQIYQQRFLQNFFDEEAKDRSHFCAGGAMSSEFKLDENLAELTVKGVVCDEIQTLHEAFVADIEEDWKNSTRLMVAIGSCKAMIHSWPEVASHYASEQDVDAALWTTICAGQLPQGLGPMNTPQYQSSWPPETPPIMQHKVWSSLLPEIPSAWQSEAPILTVLESDRLEAIERAMTIDKVSKSAYPNLRLVQTMRGIITNRLDFIDNEWTDAQRLQYAKEFQELADLWQTQPYDLYHRPFDLPFVIPDPYWETRRIADKVARLQSISARHNTWTSAIMMNDASETQRFRRLLMEEIKKQPAVTPQGLENAELIQYALGRRFVITKSGHFGLAPPAAEVGDKIALIQGADVPFVIRKTQNAFELVGEAYIDGMMDGKVMDQWQRVLRELPDIVLR